MAAQLKCNCQSCTIRGLVGPAVVITLGVLWLLHEARGGIFYFGSTWPVLLIVIGLLHVASSMASREGHGASAPPLNVPPGPSTPPSAGGSTQQTPYSSQGQ